MNLDAKPAGKDAIDDAYATAREAALGVGKALLRQKRRGDFQGWTALLASCGLTPDRAQQFMRLAEEPEVAPPVVDIPPLREHLTVVCGWCAYPRAERGKAPKHISGPKEHARIAHGVCADCQRTVSRRLDRLRKKPEPHGCTKGELAAQHAEDWDRANARLRGAFHYIEQALAQVQALGQVENVAARDGVQEEVEALTEVLTNLSRLAAELVLVSEGDDYDDEALRPAGQDP